MKQAVQKKNYEESYNLTASSRLNMVVSCLLLFGIEHHISSKHAQQADECHSNKYGNKNCILLR